MDIISKSEAVSAGLIKFFTGAPCKRCHISERNTRGGACRRCCYEFRSEWSSRNPGNDAARLKIYAVKNQELVAANKRAWVAANKQKKKALDRAYYLANADELKERAKAWNIANPQCKRVLTRNRRARLSGASGRHTRKQIDDMLVDQKSFCAHAWCGNDLTTGYHIDHVMPVSLGGDNDISNIQLLCPTCNFSKGAKHPDEYYASAMVAVVSK